MSRYMGLTTRMAEAVAGLMDTTVEDAAEKSVGPADFDRSEAWLDAQLEPFDIDPDEIRVVARAKASYAENAVAAMVRRGDADGLYTTMLSMIASAYREGLLVGLLYEAGLDPREVDVEPDDSLITDDEEIPPGGYVQSSTGRSVLVLGVDRGGMVVGEIHLREPTADDPGTSRERYHRACFLREFVRADDVPFIGGQS